MRTSPEQPAAHARSSFLAWLWAYLRPALGWLCLGLGVLGTLVPILPGVALLAAGVGLLGRDCHALRLLHLYALRGLRRWGRPSQPVARWLLRSYWRTARLVWGRRVSNSRASHKRPQPADKEVDGERIIC